MNLRIKFVNHYYSYYLYSIIYFFKYILYMVNKYLLNKTRSFGALVSWDSSVSVGSTFGENDESITHQIVDRPNVNKKYLSR